MLRAHNLFVWARNKHVMSEWTLFLALQLPSLNANGKMLCNHSCLKREDGDLLADWCQIYVTADPAAVWICIVAPEGLWLDRTLLRLKIIGKKCSDVFL
jgi:hypothetical protein